MAGGGRFWIGGEVAEILTKVRGSKWVKRHVMFVALPLRSN